MVTVAAIESLGGGGVDAVGTTGVNIGKVVADWTSDATHDILVIPQVEHEQGQGAFIASIENDSNQIVDIGDKYALLGDFQLKIPHGGTPGSAAFNCVVRIRP